MPTDLILIGLAVVAVLVLLLLGLPKLRAQAATEAPKVLAAATVEAYHLQALEAQRLRLAADRAAADAAAAEAKLVATRAQIAGAVAPALPVIDGRPAA